MVAPVPEEGECLRSALGLMLRLCSKSVYRQSRWDEKAPDISVVARTRSDLKLSNPTMLAEVFPETALRKRYRAECDSPRHWKRNRQNQ